MGARANDQTPQATASPTAGRRRPAKPGGGSRPGWVPPAPSRLTPLRELARVWADAYGWRGPLSGPTVDTRLVTTYSPCAMRRAEWEADQLLTAEGRGEHDRPPAEPLDCERPEDPEGPEALGLSPDRNSDDSTTSKARTGLGGLTPEGARNLRRATCALEENRDRLAFWTITLGDPEMAVLQELDAWATFQDHVRTYLRRALIGAKLPPLACAVAELHPQRTERTGRPCPHLHVVFVGRRSRWERWGIDRHQLDGIIRRSFRSATGQSCSTTAAGNVQPVRRSVSRYLAKYMTKGSRTVGTPAGVANSHGLPRQWWFWTRELRALVLAHLVPVPFPFLRWCHAHRDVLAELGRLVCGEVEIAGGKGPPVFWLRWPDPAAPALLYGEWVEIGCPMAA